MTMCCDLLYEHFTVPYELQLHFLFLACVAPQGFTQLMICGRSLLSIRNKIAQMNSSCTFKCRIISHAKRYKNSSWKSEKKNLEMSKILVAQIPFFQLKTHSTPTLTVYSHNPYSLKLCGS